MDFSKLRKEFKRVESQGQNTNYLDNFVQFPEKEGTVVIRILPPADDNVDNLFCITRLHRMNDKSYHCPCELVNDKWQGNCPICNYYKKLWKDADNTDSEKVKEALIAEARDIKPAERCYYNCIVRKVITKSGEELTNVGPKILSIGTKLHGRILRALFGDPAVDEPELGDITHPETGRDLKIIKKISKSGSQSFPNYDQSKFLEPSPLGTKEQIKTWMANLHDLKALRQVKSTEELTHALNVFRGIVQEESDTSSTPQVVAPSMKIETVSTRTDETDESIEEDEFFKRLRSMSS